MRGRDQSSGNLFSYVDLEERVQRMIIRCALIREIVERRIARSLSSEFETALFPHGSAHRSWRGEASSRRYCCISFYSRSRSERRADGAAKLRQHARFAGLWGYGLDDGVWDVQRVLKTTGTVFWTGGGFGASCLRKGLSSTTSCRGTR